MSDYDFNPSGHTSDYYLKASNECALYRTLEDAGVVRGTDDGYIVTDPYAYVLDVIGTIYKPTGEVIEQDGMEIPVMEPLPGYHANLRASIDFDPVDLESILIYPQDPVRRWA